MFSWIFSLFAAVAIYFFIQKSFKSKIKLPPGPIVWPIIGNVVELATANATYPHLALAALAKKYGNVIGFGFGPQYSVLISSFEDMRDILKKPEVNEYRFEAAFVRDRGYNKQLGIIWGAGETWWEIRRFTLRALKDFGFGKKEAMEHLIKEEADVLLEEIESNRLANDGVWAVDFHYLSASVLNALWSIIGGYRFDHNDPLVLESLRLSDAVVGIVGHNNIYITFPALKRWFPKLVKHDAHMQIHRDNQAAMRNLIEDVKRKRAERVDTTAQNFIETFLDEIEKNREQDSIFTEEQMVVTMLDLFMAGSETTSMTLSWAILFLTLNPDSQRKVRIETLEARVRLGQNIPMDIAAKLPYINAVMLETIRLGIGVPVPPPRLVSEDFQYKDFVIPKGAALFSNVTLMFMDEQFWGDPEVFRPERFLNDTGLIIPQLAERVAVFGFGKRRCLGETLAWDSLVMFVMEIFGKFTLEPIEGREPSAENPVSGITIRPRPYSVRVVAN